MGSVAVNCRQLADGPGQPLVLSHALGLTHQMWVDTAAHLGSERPVFAYDHRGHGESPNPGTAWTLDDLVEDAARLIEQLGRGPVVFAGVSMGAMVAQGLLIRHPSLLRGAVLAHTVSVYPDAAKQAWAGRIKTVKSQGINAVINTVAERYLSESFRSAHPAQTEELRRQILKMDAAAYAHSCAAIAAVNWTNQLDSIRTPVAVIAGRFDAGAPLAEAERISAAIPGASLNVMERSAHLSPMEEPDPFCQVLQNFLASL